MWLSEDGCPLVSDTDVSEPVFIMLKDAPIGRHIATYLTQIQAALRRADGLLAVSSVQCSLPEPASSKYHRPKPKQMDVDGGSGWRSAARQRQTTDALEFVGMGCEGCGFSRFDVSAQRGGDDDV